MNEFDAIVIGAGPAGCAAAYEMARQGLNVLVLERGQYPGAKNMWGGAFFGPLMNDLFPNFLEEAPVERLVSRHIISFLTEQESLSIDFKSNRTGSHAGFIILRAKFDQWLAGKVEQAGAIIASGLAADDLVMDGRVVKGVRAGDDEFMSNVVVLADGVNSLLALKRGFRSEFTPHDLKQGVKEVIRLPREVIEERFNLQGNEGVVMECIGACTRGLPGGGFLYTNEDSISVGVVVQLSEILEKKVKASDLLEEFKSHPTIAPLIRQGEMVEYSAHLIPVSGVKMMPPLYADGLLIAGDAAAMVLGTGLILEGGNFAMASGIAAAETVIKAHSKGAFSQTVLSHYEELLKERFVLKDMHTFRNAPEFLENERIYQVYPKLACEAIGELFKNDGMPRVNSWKSLLKVMKGKISLPQLISDAMKARTI
ncbi:MAG: FAD-dependent oxidoreductase [Smithellaceae bacterium]